MKISEKRLNQVIKESINKVLAEAEWTEVHGSVGEPYDARQAAINKAAIGRVGNKSYDDAKKADTSAKHVKYHSYEDWKANHKPKGVSWKEYNEKEL